MKLNGISVGALVLGATLGFASAASASTVLNVTWSGETQNLGTISGDGSGADFYDYSGGTTNSGLDLQLATAYAFVHESNTSGDLSFGMVFTGSNVATPRSTCAKAPIGDPSLCRTTFEGVLTGASASSTVSVKDDGRNIFGDSDRSGLGANGYYQLIPFTGTTDGFVVDGITTGTTLTMDVSTFDKFENLVFVSGSEDAPIYTAFNLNNNDADLSIQIGGPGPALRIQAPSAVPLPAGMVLLLSGLGVVGGLRARSNKRS